MKLLLTRKKFPAFDHGVVATIGNFDGVHLGHQSLLSLLHTTAKAYQLPSMVLLFEPQPAEFFQAVNLPTRLSSLREKLLLLAGCDIDYVYCLRFNQVLATTAATDFAHEYFFSWLRVRHLIVGQDFRFGIKRQGDVNLLKSLALEKKCTVQSFDDITVAQERVSSTKIRALLAAGNLTHAARLLGRPFSLLGRVIQGDGRGRQWGIPTANINVHGLNLPLNGVFCVSVERQNHRLMKGVANIGVRPTVDGLKNVLEIHLFDFQSELYGERLRINFLHKLRDEIKFQSVDDLIAQIKRDIFDAQAYADTYDLNLGILNPPTMLNE